MKFFDGSWSRIGMPAPTPTWHDGLTLAPQRRALLNTTFYADGIDTTGCMPSTCARFAARADALGSILSGGSRFGAACVGTPPVFDFHHQPARYLEQHYGILWAKLRAAHGRRAPDSASTAPAPMEADAPCARQMWAGRESDEG